MSLNRKSGHRERLRERFLHGDVSSRTEEALLELLLTFGVPRRDVQPLAKALLFRFGNLDQVLAADQSALCSVAGVDSNVSTLIKLVDCLCSAKGTLRPASGLQELPGPKVAPAPPTPEYVGAESVTVISLAQSEIPLNLPGQSELPLAPKIPTVRERKTIQDVHIQEGLLALKLAHEANSPEELQDILVKQIGQNSMETRRRYARSIVSWFFHDGLTGLLPRLWQAYNDEAINRARTIEKNKGVNESRTLERRPTAAEDIGFPFAAQVALVTRQHAGRKDETVGLITDLTLDELPAVRWLESNRMAWGIENATHQRLDVSLNDDRCRLRNPKALWILGMIRRLVISLFMHWRARHP